MIFSPNSSYFTGIFPLFLKLCSSRTLIYIHWAYSGQYLAFLKSCETQDKFPNFLWDFQDSKNFQFFLLFLSFQPEKLVNFTTNIFYVLKKCIFLNKSHEKLNKFFFVNPSLIFCENTSNFSQKKRVLK